MGKSVKVEVGGLGWDLVVLVCCFGKIPMPLEVSLL